MKNQKGQALISLMFFIIIALFLVSAAVVMLSVSAQSTTRSEGEEIASRVAESAGETALIKLLRDPAYSGENFTFTDGDATVTITGSTITINATSGNFVKKLVIQTNLTNNILNVSSWKETY